MRWRSRGRTASVAGWEGAGCGWRRRKNERFSDLRLQQAIAVGAEVLVTACPYCISQFEDSRLTLKDGQAIEIKDITEILQEVHLGARSNLMR